MHATNSWLQPGKVNIALGPDCDDSPHSIRASSLDLGIAPYLAVLFGPQKADQGHPNKTVKQEGSQAPDANQAQNNELPSPEEVLVTLRVQVDSCRPADLSALTIFFCSLLLRCDLLAKKVPGRAPYSQHIMIRNWT